jgi:dihydroorotate dehydrogenase (NAD+) catalytic subunit
MNKLDLSVDLNGLILKNPITVASGTFGFGREYADYIDLNNIGGISVKGLTLEPRKGNPTPRVVETPMGMINSVGLQNPGVEAFIKEEIPYLRQFDTKIIANINGSTLEDYCGITERLSSEDVDSLELNISCPNVKNGGMAFGTDPEMVAQVVSEVRKRSDKHLIVKLSPNVTNIGEIAKIAEANGADALSLINTLTGMAIDVNTRKPMIANVIGGLSGPAVKPVAIKLVHDVYKAVKIPILGMGGIMTWQDGIEFMLAGADAISIGTANFINPKVTEEVLKGMTDYFIQQGLASPKEIKGGIIY